MKKLFYLFTILFAGLFAACDNGQYVDLGLPSGTLWCAKNEGGDHTHYTYDEAISNFGSKLPTKEQLEELMNQCTWTWTGSGYKVVGPNGNSIYFPAAGSRYCGGDVGGVGSYGNVWSSTPIGSDFAYRLGFNSGYVFMSSNDRCYGRSVRLVSCSSAETDNKEADDVKEPSTSDRINSANGHAYVDLGLSVKWATCNVGANTPEEYGDYFAWGETEPKSKYNWRTYKWCEGIYDNVTKYCRESYHGTVDNKTVLDLADDAALANWGGNWRMPTKKEQQELLNNCTWTWTTQNGVKGYLVTSKKNGNSIFLPAAGYRYNSYLYYEDHDGNYWSSSLSTYESDLADILDFCSYKVDRNGETRYYGLPVRPVLP